MTTLLEKAVDAVRTLSPAEQDAIARAMLALAGQDDAEDVSTEDLTAVLEGLGQARRGERATAEEVEAAFERFER